MTDIKIESNLCQKFINGLKEQYKMTLEQLSSFKYVGYFPNKNKIDINPLDFHLKKKTGENIWYSYFPDIEIPTHLAEDNCVCNTSIIWNHILVEDEKADELNIIIIGSECIQKFCDIKVSKKLKCNLCDNKVNNSISGLCGVCRKKRFCDECNNVLPKGKRGKYCCFECDPEKCNKCGGNIFIDGLCWKCWYK